MNVDSLKAKQNEGEVALLKEQASILLNARMLMGVALKRKGIDGLEEMLQVCIEQADEAKNKLHEFRIECGDGV